MRVLQHVVALSFIVLQVATAQTPDGDMELADRGPWEIYGTPVTVEKSTFARGGARSLHVVTDNKDTMGGNYEGTSYSLGARKVGDLVEVSFWFNAKGGQTICVGMGPGYFVNAWWLSGTDWTRADVSLRCPQDGDYTVWISQGSAAAEFYLDDFIVNVTRRPSLGTAAPDRRVTLAGGPLRLSLCRDSGAICGVENTATGEVYAAAGQRQPLLGLELLTEDGLGYERIPFERLRLADLKVEGEGSAELRFGVEGLEIEVAVSVRMGEDGSASFVGTLRNGSARTVTSLELPMVYGLCPAVNPDALTLVHPTVCGQITPKALKSDGCKATYPGQAVMGWLDLSGEQGGVYLATHDSRSLGTRLMALPAPGPSFDMSLTKELPVKPGVTCEFPAAVLAVHTGDWHASADRYRAWAREWMQPPDVPDWLRRSDGWVLTGIQNGLPFRQLPDIYRQAQWMGIDYLHVQGQGIDTIWDGPDGKPRFHDLTYPYPTPRFGTVPELKQAVRRIHDESGHVMFYFLYDRWTPSHSTADDFGSGRRADVPAPYHPPGPEFYPTSALIEQPGKQAPTEHPLGEERMMCLGSPGWQEWMRHWAVDVYAKEYGADGFYWDVMGRNGPFRCFNAAHGHSGESEWAGGCAKVLSNTIAQGRAINPDYSTAIEGCSDVLGQWVGFHLMSGATLTPNVFRYTFPEILCVDGFSNHTFKLTGPQKARRVFLEGERFDLHGYDQRVKKVL
ncbi:MAG: hypothetical protein FJX74_14875, partial [Armatimonadetes bacterium]|nr:hypothetical protein [Armatimonadota bacterium]